MTTGILPTFFYAKSFDLVHVCLAPAYFLAYLFVTAYRVYDRYMQRLATRWLEAWLDASVTDTGCYDAASLPAS